MNSVRVVFPMFNLALLQNTNTKTETILESSFLHGIKREETNKTHFREQAELCIRPHTFCMCRPCETWPRIYADK